MEPCNAIRKKGKISILNKERPILAYFSKFKHLSNSIFILILSTMQQARKPVCKEELQHLEVTKKELFYEW